MPANAALPPHGQIVITRGVQELSAQKGWVTGARRWVNDSALSRRPERRQTELAAVRTRNAPNPALLRA